MSGDGYTPIIPHCQHCGRQMIEYDERVGFNSDGSRRTMAWWVCPRFGRSWHNLWFGGWMHHGVEREPDFIGLELRWL